MRQRWIRLTIFGLLVLQLSGVGSVGHAGAEVTRISTPELKKLLDAQSDVLLVNVLPPIIYDSKHLPGSINCPIGKMARQRQLPFPLEQPVIFYCMGVL